MFRSVFRCARRLWADDRGSIIATEYLALGSIVGLGTIAGLHAMREATNEELKEYGNSVHAIRQSYQVPTYKAANGVKPGSAASDVNPTMTCP